MRIKDFTFFFQRLAELRAYLLARNYKTKTIDNAIEKVKSFTRTSTMKRKDKNTQNKRIPLVATYHPGLPNLHGIIRKYFNILHSSERCKRAIPELPIVAFRRPKNLRDRLVRAKLKSEQSKPRGFFKCNDNRCFTCPFTENTESVTCTNTSIAYQIKQHITCKSYNVIYLITCKRCQKQYIGKTNNPLHIRFTGTRSQIKTKKNDPVARHFNSNGHSISDVHITPFDLLPFADSHTLLNKETYWIKVFNVVQPHGINAHSQSTYPIARYD